MLTSDIDMVGERLMVGKPRLKSPGRIWAVAFLALLVTACAGPFDPEYAHVPKFGFETSGMRDGAIVVGDVAPAPPPPGETEPLGTPEAVAEALRVSLDQNGFLAAEPDQATYRLDMTVEEWTARDPGMIDAKLESPAHVAATYVLRRAVDGVEVWRAAFETEFRIYTSLKKAAAAGLVAGLQGAAAQQLALGVTDNNAAAQAAGSAAARRAFQDHLAAQPAFPGAPAVAQEFLKIYAPVREVYAAPQHRFYLARAWSLRRNIAYLIAALSTVREEDLAVIETAEAGR